MRPLFGLLIVTTAFAQAPERTISVQVMRSVSLRLDQLTVGIYVTATADLDVIVEALSSTGVTAADLREINQRFEKYTHRFEIVRPSEQFGDILFGLQSLQSNPPDAIKSLDFNMGLSVSAAESDAKRRGLLPDMEREGRVAADRIGAPMGVRAGSLLLANTVPQIGGGLVGFFKSGSDFTYPLPTVPSNNRAVFLMQLTFAMET